MKTSFKLWLLLLAGTGLLAASAQAEETASSVMTALSSTTLSGYVDTSIQWSLGTGNVPRQKPAALDHFERELREQYLTAVWQDYRTHHFWGDRSPSLMNLFITQQLRVAQFAHPLPPLPNFQGRLPVTWTFPIWSNDINVIDEISYLQSKGMYTRLGRAPLPAPWGPSPLPPPPPPSVLPPMGGIPIGSISPWPIPLPLGPGPIIPIPTNDVPQILPGLLAPGAGGGFWNGGGSFVIVMIGSPGGPVIFQAQTNLIILNPLF
jgi:hypothetical protein